MPYNQNKTNYRTLFAEIKQISTNTENQNQVFAAMKRVIKDNRRKIQCQCKCNLLKRLRTLKIGTNDVEYVVMKLRNKCSNSFNMNLKMKMMRRKISEAYELLRKAQTDCNEAWRK